ncbi:MAG: phosphoglycerate kinase [Omnitrophica WOR_2 bacterium GWA2_37_7]|nr:MAG: phosphoglycerate kinase [Omnitrophica WOR_2 bacterium GWA2_37_7]
MDFLTLKNVNLQGKRVLVRVDYNVAIDNDGNIKDDTRIRNSIPTIKLLQQEGAKIILLSHLGRPKNREPKLMLDKVAHHLSGLLKHEVRKVDDCIGTAAELVVATLANTDILMLENIRFHPEEEKNDLEFARMLARLADIYINDALAVSHRSHASVSAITHLLPSYGGPLLEQEVHYFEKVIKEPESPFVVVIGGAKISDKIGVILNLLPKVDYLLVGGATANTLLQAKGIDMAASLVEMDKLAYAINLLAEGGDKLIIPIDVVAESANGVSTSIVDVSDITSLDEGSKAKDIGPKTIELFKSKLENASMVLLAGPLGLFEDYRFSDGTLKILQAIGELNATRIAGGGDTLAAVSFFKMQNNFTFLSTAGGAMLEFLEGKKLPGLEALEHAKRRMMIEDRAYTS